MMARKDRMLPFPSQDIGEDAMFLSFAYLRKAPIHVLEGYGWCYLYCFHGENTLSRHHHEQMNHGRSRPLDQAEIDHVIGQMQNEYDPDFTLQRVLSEYRFQHSPIEVQAFRTETTV